MGVSYFLLLSCLGFAITAQAQECSAPIGGLNMGLRDSDILLQTFPDGTKVTFVCDIGYQSAGGSGTITCTAGNWSPVRLQCERKNCGSGGEVENGDIDYPTGTQFGDKMVITCNVGYRLIGRNEIYCEAKGWSDRLPVCEAESCDPPPPVANGFHDPETDTYKFGEVVVFTCQKDYTLNGSKSISCSANGKFKPDPPKCVKVNCKEPKIPNGEWVRGSRPPYGYHASVTYACISGYKMTGKDTLLCEINSQWTPELPICTRVVTPTEATAAPTPIPTTTTTTTTTTTARPYSTKKPTAPGPINPENKGNNLGITLGIFVVILVIAAVGACIWCKGVPGLIEKRGKCCTRQGHSHKEAANDGEGIALA